VGYILSIVVVRMVNEYDRFLCREAMGIFSEAAEYEVATNK